MKKDGNFISYLYLEKNSFSFIAYYLSVSKYTT